MRGLTHRWVIPRRDAGGGAASTAGFVGLEPLVARVLVARGVTCADSARAFCEPKLTELHDPSLLPQCTRAAERLLSAARQGEPIAIYGDYDVDGVCAVAILWHTLRILAPGADVRTYIPHRIDEGYGLHADAVERLAAEGTRVIVSVDCGITAFEAAAAAAQAGVDLIITDHHNPVESGDRNQAFSLPPAYAIVHPRVPEPGEAPYPCGDLCGAAVAFKLAWRMSTLANGGGRVGPEERESLMDSLSLAALATITDVVPLVAENRIIAAFGLRRIKATRLPGLRALIEASGLAGDEIDSEDAGFALGPRLNACGRMGHAREALQLLTTHSAADAKEIAAKLSRLNRRRQELERAIFESACMLAERLGMTGSERRAIVLADESWHAGVVGIVCSRMIGRFHRPTILMQRSDGECKGSGRSIEGFNLHAALSRCAGHLEHYGGHDMAAGLCVREDALPRFVDAFIAEANRSVSDDMLTPSLAIDCEATMHELTERAVTQLRALSPFGRCNPEPRILVRGLTLARSPSTIGAHGKHLSLQVRRGDTSGKGADSLRELRMVAWGWGERAESLRSGQTVDAVLTPRLNTWNGRSSVEAEVKDLRLVGTGRSALVTG